VAEYSPIPVEEIAEITTQGFSLADVSIVPRWRVFSGYDEVYPGMSRAYDEHLVWSVCPGEWTVTGIRPDQDLAVELTHVRLMFRLNGQFARHLLAKICALDLNEQMFPDGAAGRTVFAGVATELVRADQDGVVSFLILVSRSFGRYIYEVLADAGKEFGLDTRPVC